VFKAIFLAAQLAVAPESVDEAKAMADANEASLSRDLTEQLLESQGQALGTALAACGRPHMDLAVFTVVLSLNADGSVKRSWRKGDTYLAKCMHAALDASGLAGEWPEPFYTSIVLTLREP